MYLKTKSQQLKTEDNVRTSQIHIAGLLSTAWNCWPNVMFSLFSRQRLDPAPPQTHASMHSKLPLIDRISKSYQHYIRENQPVKLQLFTICLVK